MSNIRTVLGIGFFIIMELMCFALLNSGKIKGPEFAALVVVFMVVSFFIVLLPRVQELSIGGSLLRLNQVKEESEQIVQDLKDTRIEMFRILLNDSLVTGGFWGNDDLLDERVDVFLKVYKKIVDANCKNELKEEIVDVLKLLTLKQSNKIKRCSKILFGKFGDDEDVIAPQEFSLSINDEIYHDFHQSRRSAFEFLQAKKEIIEAIDAYSKIYVVYLSELKT